MYIHFAYIPVSIVQCEVHFVYDCLIVGLWLAFISSESRCAFNVVLMDTAICILLCMKYPA